jgi:hypothetical protein
MSLTDTLTWIPVCERDPDAALEPQHYDGFATTIRCSGARERRGRTLLLA